ncbi:AFR322Cp [Eremothecium gossypii ATCC 10895]|uniref:AFR322Cp n=1 Tax=Eremothecium gossypii (strain ATCC 10895 / CBS 109.51 / FGSC 9923 / NRRL Y-1056) TaxID=284811 RepID=Q753J0_EREGS|nr:AFR322Cp [Eremothecium gossypii ATCC 10895]AAS53693.1 AFR322Cp [Eremothecium gossypii ATCC 10895]AEY98006.1 FAFR322Cp [Eremothecium gossypii FDAG1]
MESVHESINSYASDASNGKFLPQSYVPQAQQQDGRGGGSLRLVPTETVKSLQEMGLSSEKPIPDVNAPSTSAGVIFPEEYTLETPTGLVKIATLVSLGRTGSAVPRGGSGTEPENDKGETGGQELDEDIELVTFVIGDPENPHNWSLRRRWAYTLLLSLLVVAVAYGSACVTAGMWLITRKYDVSTEVAILSCSLVVLGYGVGQLVWAPLSDLYGRRITYFTSLFLYVVFNIPCAVAPNIQTLLVCRFICGVLSSSGLCLVGGSLADMFPADLRGLTIAFFAFAPYGGPVFAPLINGFIAVRTERLDLIFWVNMALAGAVWLLVALVPETYAPIILKRRAEKLRKLTGNQNIMTEQEAQGLSLSAMVQTCLLRPLYFIFTEPVLDLMCFYVCLIYSLLYAFFCAYPVIFSELYGYKDDKIGLMFLPIIIGASLALATTYWCEKKYRELAARRPCVPEDRLLGAMIGAPFSAIALWILGATSYKHIIWVGPASSGLAFGYGMVMVYYSLNNYIIDTYALYASSALAAKVFLRSAGGAAFPLFTRQMYHRLGLQWASWLLAFVATALIALPFAFDRYGAALRRRLSKHNYSGIE